MTMRSSIGTISLILAAGAGMSAQEVTGTITGTVRDAKGSPIAGVSLRLVSVGGVQSRTLSTDAQGTYRVPLLLPGEYTLTATKDGYITAKAEFRVTGGGVVRQDVDLKSATTASAIVEVVSTAAQVDKTQTKTASTFTQDEFAEIPISGGLPSRALAGIVLAPGVTGSQSLYQSVRGGGQGQTQYLVNGLSVRDNITMQGRPQDVILDDLVEESQIILSPLNAKYGDSSAGLINIIEKTGGNEFTGGIRVKLDRPTWTALRPNGYNRNGIIPTTAEPASVDDLARTYEISITGPLIKDVLTFTYGTRLQPTAAATVSAGPTGANSFTYFQGGLRRADTYQGGYPGGQAFGPTTPGAVAATTLSGPTRFTFHQGRLYWQINQNHSLDYSHSENANYFFDFNGGNFPTIDTSTDTDQHSINRFRQLTYRGLLGGASVLEVRYGKRESTIKFDSGPGDPINLIYGPNTMTGLQGGTTQWGVNGATSDSQPELRNTESATINYQFFIEAGGSHSFDVGMNYIKTIWGTVQNSGGPNGQVFFAPGKLYAVDDTVANPTVYGPNNGFIVFNYANAAALGINNPAYFTYMQQYIGVSQAQLLKPTRAYYINDLWTLNSHLSLMAGLRYEGNKYTDGRGEKYSSHTLSPRTELKWDLGGDQKRILSLSYGEFRGNVGERITRQFSTFRNTTIITRYWNQNNPVVGGPADYVVTKAQLTNIANYGTVFSFDVPDAIYAIDHGFKPERDKEIVLGFRRSYTTGGYLSLNLVNRTWDDLPGSYGSVNPITIQDPTGSGLQPKINYLRTLVNDPSAKRYYRGMEAEFKVPLLGGKAAVQGSYTYARLTSNSTFGDNTAFGPTQTLATVGLFRDQFHNLGVGSNQFEPTGPLATNIGNSVRLLGLYTVQSGKLRSTVTLLGRYQDGAPQDQTNTVAIPNSTFTTPFVSGLNPGFNPGNDSTLPRTYNYFYGGRGEFTTPHTLFFDFGYQLQMPVNKKVMFFSELQVTNVFNHLYPTVLNRTSSGAVQLTPVGYRVSSAVNFGYPTSFTSFSGARDFNVNVGIRF